MFSKYDFFTLGTHTHIYIIYILYIYNHENNVPFRLSPQRLHGNSCTWAHDVWFSLELYIFDRNNI